MKLIFKFFTALILFFLLFKPVLAQGDPNIKEEILEAEVTKIIDQKNVIVFDNQQIAQTLQLKVSKGSLTGEIIQLETGKIPTVAQTIYKVGDRLIVGFDQVGEEERFYIIDFIRRDSLLALFIIFLTLVLFIAKKKGLTSVLGMVISFFIIFSFILPQINNGANSIIISIISSLILIPITFYLSHGFNQKTTTAIIGTLIALIITSILASIFVNEVKLTGFATEDAAFLSFAKDGSINMKNLLLAGMIVGLLGILDDITIAQSAVVYKLAKAYKKIGFSSLYKKSMEVGQDHIASMVNTLILVYAGANLPLFLLFIDKTKPFMEVINYEMIASEIVNMLIGSIGLIIAVPITTFLACFKSTS